MLPLEQENPADEEREKQTCLKGVQGSVEWVSVGCCGFRFLTLPVELGCEEVRLEGPFI